jgi:FkbM family methyltransferase
MQGASRGKLWIVGSGTHGCWLGTYELEKRLAFERTVGPGQVVYDVGAHAGYYTLLASHLVGPTGRVVAFEPLPRNVAYLREHIRVNRLRNVTVIEAAVSDREGRAAFNRATNPSMGHLDPLGELDVGSVALDSLISRGETPPPDHIKMDIEGGELAALEGARELLLSRHPAIFLGTHGAEMHGLCCRLLTSLGYGIRAIGAHSLEDTRELLALGHDG